MSLDFEFEIPVDGEIDERALENRGKLPTGYYRAECADCYPDQKDNSGVKVLYKITAGPFTGRELTDTVWDPEQSETEEKRKSATQRMLLVFKRLGCREEKTNKVNLRLAIGKQVVLHLKKPQEAYCQTCDVFKPKGDRAKKCPTCGGAYKWLENEDGFANVDFDGVYPLDHPLIPADVREKLQLGPARSPADEHTAAAPAKSKRTTPAQPAAPPTSAPVAPSREARLAAALQDL